MTPNKQKLIERLINGGDDLFTSFVIAGLEENLEIIYDEVKKILSMDRIPDHRMDDLIALRADGEATILILQYYGAGDYPVAAGLMAKAHIRIQGLGCPLHATQQPDMSQEDDTEAQLNPALKAAQERTKGVLTEANTEMSKHFVEMADRIEELEANLAKALELALKDCPFQWGTGPYNDWWYERRAKVAELTSSEAATKEGGKDD